MDTYEFVAALVSAGAWPISAIVLAAILRRPLSGLLSRTESAEGFGAKVVFNREIKSITAAVENEVLIEAQTKTVELVEGNADETVGDILSPPLLPSPPIPEQPNPIYSDKAQSLGLIVAAWQGVERSLRLAAATAGLESEYAPLFALLKTLHTKGVLQDDTFSALERLRDLRNQVAHARIPPPPVGEAREYSETAGTLSAIVTLNTAEWTKRHVASGSAT